MFTSLSIVSRSQRALRGLVALVLVAVALLGTASAQSIADILPQDTFVAFGVSDLSRHEAKFQTFIDEWNRLGLSERLEAATPADESGEIDELTQQFEGLDLLDFLGGEVWFAVSGSSSNPLPAITVAGRFTDAAIDFIDRMLAEELDDDAMIETFAEGSMEFTVRRDASGSDEFGEAMALARQGDFLAISTNPDVLRGVLRRYQGTEKNGFSSSAGYQAALAPLIPSSAFSYLDLPQIVALAAPFAQGMGFDQSVERASNALKTIGTVASAGRLTDAGIESFSVQVLGAPNLDPTLYGLLSRRSPASTATRNFVPAGSVAYQVQSVDLGAWWGYLNELVAGMPELGVGNIDQLLMEMVGLDINALLFSWMGDDFAAITVTAPVASEVGVSAENLLGDSLYLVEITNADAARAGLEQLLAMAGEMAGAFIDPMGEGSDFEPTTRNVAGSDVTVYTFAPGVEAETAIVDGYLVIATSSSAMDAALNANASGSDLTGQLASLASNLPSGASSVSLSDDAAAYTALADTVMSQFGLLFGMTGGAGLDFDAAESAGEGFSEFIHFVADRFGGSFSYSVADGNVVRGYGLSTVTW